MSTATPVSINSCTTTSCLFIHAACSGFQWRSFLTRISAPWLIRKWNQTRSMPPEDAMKHLQAGHSRPSVSGGERKVSYGTSDFGIELEEGTETTMRKESMRSFGENMIERMTFSSICESLGCQEFLDGKMRELYYLTASLVDDGDQTGARGQRQSFCIQWPRSLIRRRGRCRIGLD
jgi:hypothetical protein